MATVTLANTPNENKTFYNKTLISRLTPQLLFAKYGQKKPIPKHEGDTVNFRKFNSLTAAVTPLTEGVTPSGSSIDVTKVEATVRQYGDFVTLSDKIDMVGIDPVVAETSAVLGEQAGLTVDTVVRDIVVAGTNVLYAGGGTSASASKYLTGADVKKAVRALKKANAKPYEGNSYIGIIDPETASDLMDDPMWQDVSKYNGGTAIMDGEIGKLYGVRFIETTNVKVVSNIHSTMILGKDAYGVCDVEKGSTPQIIVKEAGSAGTADPLNQRSSVGWKTLFTAVRLNELAMIRIEHGVSA
jgi:N4-gp56 family major capsid protein